jgi:hypothetical protein
MSAKHTPGPWQWYWRYEQGEANCGVFWEQHEGMAHSVARCPRYQKKAQWEADGRLIAAAPDLLAALRIARDEFEYLGYRAFAADVVIDAIAKAEGR